MANKPNLSKEQDFLDSLVVDYTDQSPYSSAKKNVIHGLMSEYIKGGKDKRVLQLGCSNGYETKFLSKKFGSVDVVDGSRKFLSKMKRELSGVDNVNFIESLFEEFENGTYKYDYVFCNYVLEHVLNVPYVLQNIRKCMKDSAVIFATVPNALAFSRVSAQKMGLIQDLYALTDNDVAHGHRRVFNSDTLITCFEDAGYSVVDTRGVIFKILADFQLNKMLSSGIINESNIIALQAMAEINPLSSDSVFLVASPNSQLK